MSLKRTFLVAAAVGFAVILNAYVYAHQLWRTLSGSSRTFGQADTCANPETPRTNPNKMLFISCGGYLD